MIIYYNGRKFVFHEFEILVRSHSCQNELLVGICVREEAGKSSVLCYGIKNFS